MDQVSVFDAKNKLSALLDQVEQGEVVTITRRGKAIAKLVPTAADNLAKQAAVRLCQLRQSIAERGERFTQDELKAYRDEGRR